MFRVRKRKARKLPFMTRFIHLGTASGKAASAAPEISTERIEVIDMVGGGEEEEETLSPHDISLVRY